MYNMDDARPSRAPVFIWAFLTLADTDYDCVRKLCDGRREGRSSLGWTRVTTPGPPGERKNWQKLRLMNIPGIKPESPHSSHGTDTANIFSPMCLVTGRGAHTERAENILRITNFRRDDDDEDDDPSRGAGTNTLLPQPAGAGDRIPNEFYNSDQDLLTLLGVFHISQKILADS